VDTRADPVRVTVRDLLAFAAVTPVMMVWLLCGRLTGRMQPAFPLPWVVLRGAVNLVRPRARAELSEIQPELGRCWTARVSPWIPDDFSGASTLLLLEDGRPLGPGHSLHDDIRQLGDGRYSHWGRSIFFSTSDGSDPRHNGRRYSIEELRPSRKPASSRSGEPHGDELPAPARSAPPGSRTAERTAPQAPVAAALERKRAFDVLCCPESGQSLRREGDALVSADGAHRHPIVNGIPRFVASDQYVASFSFEWNTYSTTQLDSQQGTAESARLLTDKTGLTREDVAGALVLDAGVGPGRYAEVLADWGATVVGVDLSLAVEASHRNLGHRENVLIAQADIGRLPLKEGSFDHIISIGVLHHTPSTREYFLKLPKLLRPGGRIAIWVYPNEGDYAKRNPWIPLCSRIPPRLFHGFCKVLVHLVHRRRGSGWVRWVASVFPISDQPFGLENDILDTFDSYSPRFHGTHSEEEVRGWFEDAGLVEITSTPWRTSVQGRRPATATL